MSEDKSEDNNCNGRSPTALLCNLIPHEYICIDELWSDARRDIIKKVIGSVIGDIRFVIPDFELKWSDIPEEKIDEWHDFVFGYDLRNWQPFLSSYNPESLIYYNSIDNVTEERLTYLEDLITDYIVEKFNLREQVYGTHELSF